MKKCSLEKTVKKSTVKNQCFVKRTNVVFDCLWGKLPHKVQMSLCHGSRNSSENHLNPIFYIECLSAYLGRKVAEDDSNNKKNYSFKQVFFVEIINVEEDGSFISQPPRLK